MVMNTGLRMLREPYFEPHNTNLTSEPQHPKSKLTWFLDRWIPEPDSHTVSQVFKTGVEANGMVLGFDQDLLLLEIARSARSHGFGSVSFAQSIAVLLSGVAGLLRLSPR